MFNPYHLVFSVVFSIIGFGAFRWGRSMEYWKPLAIGLVMMAYPYFMPNWVWTLAVGLILSGTLWFHHDE